MAELAPEWPGWPAFPWRVTRNIHRHLTRAPFNFHYLMVQRCITGFAAHLLRTEQFVDRAGVLVMLIRVRCEFAGLLLHLLLESIAREMWETNQAYIKDASGPEDGHFGLTEAEIEMRRTRFRRVVERAVRNFVTIMNMATLADDLKERILGHSLRFWLAGADMPDGGMLEVQTKLTLDGVVLKPCKREEMAFIRAQKPVPHLLVSRREVEQATGGGLPGGLCAGNAADRDLSNRELKEHIDGRLESLGQVQADLRQENTKLKGNLATVLAGAARHVEPDYFRVLFAVLGTGSVSGGAKALKIANSTLSGRLRAYAAKGDLYKTLFDTLDIRRKLGAKSVERFNEAFAGHQGRNCGSEDALRDLLDGLDAMNAGNWGAVRDELLDLVKAVTP